MCNVVSKIFQLPSQKGTELQPQITQMPTKLVIKGVEPGTPLAGAVADHFGGRLKQFHVKQQQNYALSPTAIHRSHIEWKGGRATYTNQGGQEYLTLEVDPQLLKELHAKSKTLPDFAVVDFVVQDSYNNYISFTAALITPKLDRAAVISDYTGLPTNGVEINDNYAHDYSWGVKDPIIMYADTADAVGFVYISNYVASLKVDFRKLGYTAMVVVDVYAYILADPDTYEDLPPVLVGSYYAGYLENSNSSVYGGQPILSTIGQQSAELKALYPELAGAYSSQGVGINNMPFYTDGSNQLANMTTYSSIRYFGYGGAGIWNGLAKYYGAPGSTWDVDHLGFSDPNNIRGRLLPEIGGVVTPLPAGGGYTGSIRWRFWRRAVYAADGSFSLATESSGNYPTPPTYTADLNFYPDGDPAGNTGWARFSTVDIGFYFLPSYYYPQRTVHHPAKKPVDITFAFYEPGTKLVSDSSNYKPIWVVTANTIPSRTKLNLQNPLVLDSNAVADPRSWDNPNSLKKIGRLVLDRATRSIAFKPT